MAKKKNGYIYFDFNKKTEKEEIAFTAWRSFFNWMSVIVAVLFVIFVTVILFFRPVTVSGDSMEPTLHDSDRLIVSSFNYKPEIGDIIVARASDGSVEPVIKRIIAVENQMVDIDYERSILYVDGVAVEEDYILGMTEVPVNEIEYPYIVPEGQYFVMGDGRDESRDSRHKTFGCIEEDRIVGEAVLRFYPFDTFGVI